MNVLSLCVAFMHLVPLTRDSTAYMIPAFAYMCLYVLHSLMVPVRSFSEAMQSVSKGNNGRRACFVKNTYFLKGHRAQAYPKPLPVFATSGNFL